MAKKVFRWLIPTLWLALAIFLSCQSGNNSSGLSHWLANNVFHISSKTFHAVLRSCAHFGVHFVLGILTYCVAYYDFKKPAQFTIKTGLIVAISDELLQLLAPGRCFEFHDIALNVLGILVATTICRAITSKRNRPLA